jgi:probable F420-dependent oxidoreductase
MKIDAIMRVEPASVGRLATRLEASGYDAAWSTETNHDPFLPLVAAAQTTNTIELGTSIAVAFARNPMNLAQIGWDLQVYTGGRMTLGFGSQIKPHITRRFSMPWSHPAARMRETVSAIRAIWDAWLGNSVLDFQGEFFTHTLMTPPTTPDKSEIEAFGLPRIVIAAVGEQMTRVAAEVGDGLIVHPFHTVGYLDAFTLPTLRDARASAGHSMDDFQIASPVFVVTGSTEAAMEAAADRAREQISFYGSTPAYRAVLEVHGWGDLQTELYGLSKQGRWADMKNLIDDDILNEFAVVRPPKEVAAEIVRRYEGRVDRLSFNADYESDPEMWASIVDDIRRQPTPTGDPAHS